MVVPLLDDYLEFVAARARPNTVLATAYDLKVFFTVVGKPVKRVRPADVMAFIAAQRSGGDGAVPHLVEDAAGLSARTVRRRLSSVSGLYGYLLARGDVAVNPVPRGFADPAGAAAPASGCAVGTHPAAAAAGPGTGRGGCAARRAAMAPGT